MAVFRAVLAVIPKVREGIKKAAAFIKKVYKRIAKVIWIIRAILLWNSILKRLDSFLKILRSAIRRLKLIPIPQIKAVLTALGRLIVAIRRAISPMRRFLQRNKRKLSRLKRNLKEVKAELVQARSKLKAINRRLLLMQVLASILEKQQDFIESIMGEKLKALLYKLVGNLEGLAKILETIVTAALLIEAALGAILQAIEPLVRQIQSFVDGLKKVLNFLAPLKNALQSLLDGLRQLMQNRIVKWILDGFSYLMDKLDALFNALLDRLGLNALIDRLVQSIPGVQQLLNALNQLSAKLSELLGKLDEIKAEIRKVRQKLDEILSIVDNIINLLKGLLAYKALIELQIPEFIQLTRDLTPEITVKDFLKRQEELLDAMEVNNEFSQELVQLNNEMKSLDAMVDNIPDDATEEEVGGVVAQLQELMPEENFSYALQEKEIDMSKLINEAIREEALVLESLLQSNPEVSLVDKKELAESISFLNGN